MSMKEFFGWVEEATRGELLAKMEKLAEISANIANPTQTRRRAQGLIKTIRRELDARREAEVAVVCYRP